MTVRRIPGGRGPVRRPGQPIRGRVRSVSRAEGRDYGVRGEARAGARTPSSRRGVDGARSASRPAAARRAAAGGAAKRTSAPQPRRYTGRAMVLCAVLVALALAYTYPVRLYLSQQADIAQMEADQAAQREHIAKLSEEVELWQDPEYIRIQARERFYMVYPGEAPFLVIFDPEGAARDAGEEPGEEATEASAPWYGTLWSSIEAANQTVDR